MKIFIGYDEREDIASQVCEFSLRRHTSLDLDIRSISSDDPLYLRNWHKRGVDRIDDIDGRPFSTDFAFARFLVPEIMGYDGWAMFVDCDFLFRADVAELFALVNPAYAAMCVPHNFRPQSPIKMDGVRQEQYFRKCWSSMVLWNCGHEANRWLTAEQVNTRTGSELHQFSWLNDSDIGALPEEWNWLAGHSAMSIEPKAIHYTEGGPWFPYRKNVHYAEQWLKERDLMLSNPVQEQVGDERVEISNSR